MATTAAPTSRSRRTDRTLRQRAHSTRSRHDTALQPVRGQLQLRRRTPGPPGSRPSSCAGSSAACPASVHVEDRPRLPHAVAGAVNTQVTQFLHPSQSPRHPAATRTRPTSPSAGRAVSSTPARAHLVVRVVAQILLRELRQHDRFHGRVRPAGGTRCSTAPGAGLPRPARHPGLRDSRDVVPLQSQVRRCFTALAAALTTRAAPASAHPLCWPSRPWPRCLHFPRIGTSRQAVWRVTAASLSPMVTPGLSCSP